jgi:kynurenine formamidase
MSRDHSGTNPCYLTEDAAALLASAGVQHVLVDFPSLDREDDAGRLAAHRAFWRYPDNPRRDCTVTEMVFVPSDVPDGTYLLNLQVLAIESDAVPSRPILFPLAVASSRSRSHLAPRLRGR